MKMGLSQEVVFLLMGGLHFLVACPSLSWLLVFSLIPAYWSSAYVLVVVDTEGFSQLAIVGPGE
jgi:hypothetical protein